MSLPPLTLGDLDNRLFATVPEVARVLRYDERTIRRAIADGQIPAVAAGVTHRVPVAWIRTQALLVSPKQDADAA